jgi:hypothetical protein
LWEFGIGGAVHCYAVGGHFPLIAVSGPGEISAGNMAAPGRVRFATRTLPTRCYERAPSTALAIVAPQVFVESWQFDFPGCTFGPLHPAKTGEAHVRMKPSNKSIER